MFFKDWKEKRNLYRGPSIDASYQVYLAKRFQKKIKMWKVNKQRTPSDGKNSHYLWQGELKRQSNVYSCTVLIQSIFKSLRIVSPPPPFSHRFLYSTHFQFGFNKISSFWEKIFCHFPISMLKLCFEMVHWFQIGKLKKYFSTWVLL